MSSPDSRSSALRSAARQLREALRTAPPVRGVRSLELFTEPVETRRALQGVAKVPAPVVLLRHRALLVQTTCGGQPKNVLVNASDRGCPSPGVVERLPWGLARVATKLLASSRRELHTELHRFGISPADIDFLVVEDLLGRDLRGLLGSRALLPNARLLVQARELDALRQPHPLERDAYLTDALRDVPQDSIVALDGDYTLCEGVHLIATPGRTRGHQSIVMTTSQGLWTFSSNGVCLDAYAPGASDIPGLRRYARDADAEFVLHLGPASDLAAQYDSMMIEKTIADRRPDRPEISLHMSSTELQASLLSPTLRPTFTHPPVDEGTISPSRSAHPR